MSKQANGVLGEGRRHHRAQVNRPGWEAAGHTRRLKLDEVES